MNRFNQRTLYITAGIVAAAIAVLLAAIWIPAALRRSEIDTRLSRAEKLTASGQYEDALHAINSVLALEQTHPQALTQRKEIYHRYLHAVQTAGDFSAADQILARATADHPDAAEWLSQSITVEPTCGKTGVELWSCALCSVTAEKPIPPTDEHQWSETGLVTQFPNCVSEGVLTFYCSVCKGMRTEPLAVNSTHTWDIGTVVKPATYTENGEMHHVCVLCSAEKTVVIEKYTDAALTITDTKLEKALRKIANKSRGTLMASDFAHVTRLDLSGCGITDITPLGALTHLTELYLDRNGITSVASLSDLKYLTKLSLWNNQIDTISPLSRLTRLTSLWLGDNSITSISALLRMTRLEQLYLHGNEITDLAPLERLTALRDLSLGHNQVETLDALAGLTALHTLQLNHTAVSDLTPLTSMQELTYLDLSHTAVSDLRAIGTLQALTELLLEGLSVTDWSPTDHVDTVIGRP